MPIRIAVEEITSSVALALIGALNIELSALYPEPGATHFRLDPADVAPGRGAFVVVRLDDEPVGCGAVRLIGERMAEIKRMYVAPHARGQGLGRALVVRLEQEARALGAERIVLETGIRQRDAIAVYQRAGFEMIPAYGEYVARPGTSLCMAKVL